MIVIISIWGIICIVIAYIGAYIIDPIISNYDDRMI